jgi:hypothetical protein
LKTARSANTSSPPATSIIPTRDDFDSLGDSHRIVPFLEIDLWAPRQQRRAHTRRCDSIGQLGSEPLSALGGPHQSAERPDHVEDFGNAALIERVDIDASTNERRGDVRLQVRKRQDKVRLEIDDFRNVRRREGGDPLLLTARPRRAHHIARNADDAPVLTKQIKRLDGLLGQADDALRREH